MSLSNSVKKINHQNERNFEEMLYNRLPDISTIDKIIIFNVGTEKVVYDSFGPRLGSKLTELISSNSLLRDFVDIWGIVGDSCNRRTLKDKYELYDKKYNNLNVYTIASDACVFSRETTSMGVLSLKDSPIRPAKALNIDMRAIGDISITVTALDITDIVIDNGYRLNLKELEKQSIEEDLLNEIVDDCANMIYNAIYRKINNYICE